MWRFKSFLRVHVFWMPSSRQNPQVKEPFCLGAAVVGVVSSASQDDSSVRAMLARVVDGLTWRLRLVLARGETLEVTLPHVDDVSENALLLLVESNIFDESSCELPLLESIKDLSSYDEDGDRRPSSCSNLPSSSREYLPSRCRIIWRSTRSCWGRLSSGDMPS